MKDEYQKLMGSIHAPESLQRRVLEAAREQDIAGKAVRRSVRPAFRAAACAVLALVLVAGGVTLRPRDKTTEQNGVASTETLPLCLLGLTAYAAGIGDNGGVLLQSVEGQEKAQLESTVQTLSLTFADGRQESGTYFLRTELLGTFTNEDGEAMLAPTLAGDPMETFSGLYAEPEDSVWFQWPVEGAHTVSLSAPYGLRADGTYFHSGIDIPAQQGTSVLAAAAGTVTEAGYDTAKGNYLVLDHGDGVETVYAHCLRLAAEVGNAVTEGEEIAAVGATGMATGPHLHFEVRQDGEARNPIAFFDAAIRDTLKMG